MPDRLSRLMDRAELRGYLAGLPWRDIEQRIAHGRLPAPVWGVAAEDKRARWDRRAVDRALDAASGLPIGLQAQEVELDRALGLR